VTERRYRRAVTAALLMMGAPLLLSLVGLARGAGPEPFLAPARPETRCVLEAGAMRHTHMTYLARRRDRVVREGDAATVAESETRGLRSCRGCHPDRATFCDRCHTRASVRLDCFGCHAY
jgi:hypothetical protein